ncbi:hypothetical protein BDV09DRAFT_197223 [Aspergillus tetrazonus]
MDSIILTGSGWGQFLDHAKQILDLDRIRDPDLQAQIPLSAWRDELGRLRIWASDVGVYQTRGGHASLDGLLNEFPTVRSQVLRQLTRIQRLLGDLEDELRNTGKDSDNNSEVEEEQEEKHSSRTAIQDIYMHFQDSINGLNRMSIIISQRTSFNTETGPPPETMHSARQAWQTQSGTGLETEADTTDMKRSENLQRGKDDKDNNKAFAVLKPITFNLLTRRPWPEYHQHQHALTDWDGSQRN